MFNIVAGASPVTITAFDVNLYGGTTARYEIYYKAGTYVGAETTAASWTMAGGVDGLYVAANNVPTRIPIPLSITIPAGQTYGFYITNTASGGLNYTTSAVTNVTLATNSDLTIVGGVGKAYPFGSTYSYRLINCTAHYFTGNINESNSLATSNATSPTVNQNSSGTSLYSEACNALISKITGSGASPISGNVTSKVWIDGVQASQYVKRHYEITPATNAATATATVTLYYTQQEFTDFNAVNVIKLPVDATDAANNKANLRIEKRAGTSSNGTGAPGTYAGSIQTITPGSVSWNSSASRWEVTFNVTGFSGFFAKTTSFTLPLRLVNFSGSKHNNYNILQWETAEEVNTKEFELQISSGNGLWTTTTVLPAKGNTQNSYSYQDNDFYSGKRFYRLKMVDQDGRFSYSQIVGLGKEAGHEITIYPNPVQDNSIQINLAGYSGAVKAKLFDNSGKLAGSYHLINGSNIINCTGLRNGIYQLTVSDQSGTTKTHKIIITH
jgi:hypothetical protein